MCSWHNELFCNGLFHLSVIPDMNTTGPAMMIGLRSSEILKNVLQNMKNHDEKSRQLLLGLMNHFTLLVD